jgi:hypothetical protein
MFAVVSSGAPAPPPAAVKPGQSRTQSVTPDDKPAAPPSSADTGPIGTGEVALLRSVVGLGGATREHLTLTTGFKKSTRNAYVQRLAARGLVVVTNDRVTATSAGVMVAGPVERPPEGAALRDWWYDRLPAGEAVLLRLIADGTAQRDALTEASGFKKSTRNAYLQRLAARGLIVGGDDDTIRPHPSLT